VRTFERPVFIVSHAFRPINRFLLAYDGSPSTERALERLTEGSVLRGLECHILSVGSATPAVRDKLQAAAGSLRHAGFSVTEHLQSGEPEKVITKAILDLDIDLLVLGKSGHSRLRQLALGSTTLELIRTCKRPVLIFP
jgi:nucleotide-binding universal stress UspA family protein